MMEASRPHPMPHPPMDRSTQGTAGAAPARGGRSTGDPATGGFPLGKVAGVRIQVDWSLLIVFGLVAFNLGGFVFPSWHPDWGAVLNWTVALGAATLFFGSVLVHELSHALVARTQGVPVHRITLFLFGGMAHMERDPDSPKAEFLIAIVGPLTSIAIGVVASFVGAQLAGAALSADGSVLTGNATQEEVRAAMARMGPVATLLLWLGPINLLLGVFNMAPGFPLDGGRLLRAGLWWGTGDLTRATRWASGAGQLMAWTLMGIGVVNMFSGAIAQGLWLLLIGWFLNNAARASYHQLLTQQALKGVSVSQLMWSEPRRVPPDLTLERFVEGYLMPSEQVAFPVERDGELLGLALFDDVRSVPRDRWPSTRVDAIMTPVAELSVLPPDAPADEALSALGHRDVDQVPIMEGNRLRGLVRRRDVLRWLALHGQDRGRG